MVKISVIIPVYNVEDYLEETLNSLLNQTILEDIEVLMIDDGSTDNSRYIIEKYALDYDNFYAFHKDNEGPGIARNYGLKKAKGEYIHFMDGDDYISADIYESLLKLNKNPDFIIFNALRFGKYNLWEDFLFKKSFKEFDKDIDDISLEKYPSLFWDTVIWNKLYKKDFLIKNNIRFIDKNILYEDILFSLESYLSANNISYTQKVGYYWRLRNNKSSITQHSSDNFQNVHDRLEILDMTLNLFKQTNYPEKILKHYYLKLLNHDLRLGLKNINHYSENEYIDLINHVYNFVKDIPEELFNELSSFKRILYEMVKNYDIDSLLYFSGLESEFNKNPYDLNLTDEYKEYINFKEDFKKLEINVKLEDISKNENDLRIKFSAPSHYTLNQKNINVEAHLLDSNQKEFKLKLIGNEIIIPLDLIRFKHQLNIRLLFKSNNIINENYLLNSKRKSFSFDNFDIDIGIATNKILSLDYVEKNDIEIEIFNVKFKNNNFIFSGKSSEKITNLFIKNIVTFEIIEISFEENENTLKFTIPYNIIINHPVKKWELNSADSLNSIKISKKFEFFKDNNKISIYNSRNKILIQNNLININQELTDSANNNIEFKISNKKLKADLNAVKNKNKDLNNENKQLQKDINHVNNENKKLKKSNKKLKNDKEKLNALVDDYKSRKVVKVADKLNSYIKK